MNALGGFPVHYRDCDAVQESKRDEALLAVGKTIVVLRRRRPLEHAPRIRKVESVIPEI